MADTRTPQASQCTKAGGSDDYPEKSGDRGHANYGWLDTYHTYYDPAHVHFRDLHVINEDRVQPGRGFGTHPHEDMEILTYVLAGALEHKDSMGTGSIIRAGDVQRMSAGTRITHSESNPSRSEPVHLLQIWIFPQQLGLEPSYEQKTFLEGAKRGRLCLVASHDACEGSLAVHQDVDLYASVLETGKRVTHTLSQGRHAWLQVARGAVSVNGHVIGDGGGAVVSNEKTLEILGDAPSELLLFDPA